MNSRSLIVGFLLIWSAATVHLGYMDFEVEHTWILVVDSVTYQLCDLDKSLKFSDPLISKMKQ